MVHLKGIHHGAFITGNLPKTLAFWCGILGFELVLEYGEGEERQYFLQLGGTRVSFMENKGVIAPPYKRHGAEHQGPIHFDHLAMEVIAKDDLFKLQEQLVEAGHPVSEVIDHGFLLSLYSFDPNHIPVEFIFKIDGSDPKSLPRFQEPDLVKELLEKAKALTPDFPANPDIADQKIQPGAGKELFETE